MKLQFTNILLTVFLAILSACMQEQVRSKLAIAPAKVDLVNENWVKYDASRIKNLMENNLVPSKVQGSKKLSVDQIKLVKAILTSDADSLITLLNKGVSVEFRVPTSRSNLSPLHLAIAVQAEFAPDDGMYVIELLKAYGSDSTDKYWGVFPETLIKHSQW